MTCVSALGSTTVQPLASCDTERRSRGSRRSKIGALWSAFLFPIRSRNCQVSPLHPLFPTSRLTYETFSQAAKASWDQTEVTNADFAQKCEGLRTLRIGKDCSPARC